MLLTIREATKLIERHRSGPGAWQTGYRWAKAGRVNLIYRNGWNVDRHQFTTWAARAGKLKTTPGVCVSPLPHALSR